MRLFFSLIVGLLFVNVLCADDRMEVSLRYQIALANLRQKEIEPQSEPEPKRLSYAEARELAIRTGKPLVIWIGKAICPACIEATEDEWVNYVAASDPRFPDDSLTMGVRHSGELEMVCQLKEWDDNHLPTLRKALRMWDDRQARGLSKRTLKDADLWPASTWSTPAMTPVYSMGSSFMGAGRYGQSSYSMSNSIYSGSMMNYQSRMMSQPVMRFGRGRMGGGGRACAT